MTGTTRSSDGLDRRRRRILFRAWHRGTREADLLLGRFADAYIERLGEPDLDAFEALLEAPDADVLAWLSGGAPAPVTPAPLHDLLVSFHHRHADDPI